MGACLTVSQRSMMMDTMESHDLTDDAARRKIFWLLQRVSSLSLWTRKRDAFARFANAYEHAAHTWPDDGPGPIHDGHFPIIAEILAAYDRGLSELARGNRLVWKRGGPLEHACRRYDFLDTNFFLIPITGIAVRRLPRTRRGLNRWPSYCTRRKFMSSMRRSIPEIDSAISRSCARQACCCPRMRISATSTPFRIRCFPGACPRFRKLQAQ